MHELFLGKKRGVFWKAFATEKCGPKEGFFFFWAQIENSIAREPNLQPTQLKQRNVSGNQEITNEGSRTTLNT